MEREREREIERERERERERGEGEREETLNRSLNIKQKLIIRPGCTSLGAYLSAFLSTHALANLIGQR